MRQLFLVTSHISKTQQLAKCLEGIEWESKIPRSIRVHDLCGIEVHIASFRKRILIQQQVNNLPEWNEESSFPNMPLMSIFLISGSKW